MTDHFKFNLEQWQASSVCKSYGNTAELYPSEIQIFKGLEKEFSNKRILDLGVGGGRTTSHLLKISPDYTGIDYSPGMIVECRRLYPNISFMVADARDLSKFDAQSFDLVLFSFNGIDNLDDEGRRECLKSIHRVLNSSGAFVFSTHNKSRKTILSPWSLEHFGFKKNPTLNPLKIAKRSLYYLRGILNASKMKPLEKTSEAYALLNDDGDQYRFLSYHIAPEQQIRQLSEAGFRVEAMVDTQGRPLQVGMANAIAESWMVYYVCRKAA